MVQLTKMLVDKRTRMLYATLEKCHLRMSSNIISCTVAMLGVMHLMQTESLGSIIVHYLTLVRVNYGQWPLRGQHVKAAKFEEGTSSAALVTNKLAPLLSFCMHTNQDESCGKNSSNIEVANILECDSAIELPSLR